MILELVVKGTSVFVGAAMPMPPELMELYSLYQKELNSSQTNEKETKLISDLNTMMRVFIESKPSLQYY